MVDSGDDGNTWSNPTPVNDASATAGGTEAGYLTPPAASSAAPQIAFSPGNSGAPGSLVFVWPNGAGATSTIRYDSTQPDGAAAATLATQAYSDVNNASLPIPIPVATSPTDPITMASESITIPAGQLPANFGLQDLSVELAIVAYRSDNGQPMAPDLADLRIQLTAPTGKSIFLLQNQDFGSNGVQTAVAVPANQPMPSGVAVPTGTVGLGAVAVNNVWSANTYAVFSDTAARRIDDPSVPRAVHRHFPAGGEWVVHPDQRPAPSVNPNAGPDPVHRQPDQRVDLDDHRLRHLGRQRRRTRTSS